MEFTNNKKASHFSAKKKLAVPVGGEIGANGLYWRKLEDGSGVWRVDFSCAGKRYKQTLGRERDGFTLSYANQRLKTLRAEAVVGLSNIQPNRNSASTPFKEAVQSFLAWSEKQHLSHYHNKLRANKYLLPEFGNLDLKEITPAHLEQYKCRLLAQGLAPTSTKTILYLISSIYRFAALSDESLSNPVRKVKRLRLPIQSMATFTDQEIDALLDAAADNCRLVTAIALAAYAGLRASEVLGLEWSNIDLNNLELRICQTVVRGELRPTTKSGRPRVVPIQKRLHAILVDHMDKAGKGGFVVQTPCGARYHKVQEFFSRVKAKAGITKKAGFHALRHTFATRAVHKGVDLPTLKDWMGHSVIETTMRYIHHDKEHSKQAMRLLD